MMYHPKARNKTIYLWIMTANVGGNWRWTTDAPQGKTDYTLRLSQYFRDVEGVLSVSGSEDMEISNVILTGPELEFKAWVLLVEKG